MIINQTRIDHYCRPTVNIKYSEDETFVGYGQREKREGTSS